MSQSLEPSLAQMHSPSKRGIVLGLLLLVGLLSSIYYRTDGSSSYSSNSNRNSIVNIDNSKPNSIDNSNGGSNAGSGAALGVASCMCTEEYTSVIDTIDKSIAQISRNWNITKFPEFLAYMHVPPASWDLQKHKFIKLILERSAKRDSKDSSFVVGFSGSSVTAGHDNYFLDAYPQKFFEAVHPSFKALGLSLDVRNGALGNNPCYPYDACIETHVGDDLDILAWEQSMNCGRDSKPIEHMIRDSIKMRKRPSIWFLLSGTPYWTESECNHSNISSLPKDLTAHEEALLKKTPKDALNDTDHLSKMSFLKVQDKYLHSEYASIGAIGQNVLAINGYKCMGPYNASFSSRALGLPTGATWHPGVLGHRLKGENLAFTLLHILRDALLDIGRCESSTCSSGKGVVQQESGHKSQTYSKTVNYLHNILNESPKAPLSCDPAVCQSETKTKCYTQYEPRAIRGIEEIIIGERPLVLNYSSVFEHLTHAPKSNGNGSAFGLPLVHDIHVKNKWTLEMSFFDVAALEKLSYLNLGYLDKKYVYFSHGTDSTLSFLIKVESENSHIMICELQKGFKKYPPIIGDLDKAAEVFIDKNVVDSSHLRRGTYQLPKSASLLSLRSAADQCYMTSDAVSRGTHVLSIKQKLEGQMINIAYILHW